MIGFLREVASELQRVTFPTRDQVFRLTFSVIGISLLAGIYLGGLDFVFTKILEVTIK